MHGIANQVTHLEERACGYANGQHALHGAQCIHQRAFHAGVFKPLQRRHDVRIIDQEITLLATVHVPDHVIAPIDGFGHLPRRFFGRLDRDTHPHSCVQAGLCCPVLCRGIQQMRPIHQGIVEQVGIQLACAALERLECLLSHHARLDVCTGDAGFFVDAIERHVELGFPQLARVRIDQARLFRHVERVLVEFVERLERIAIDQ